MEAENVFADKLGGGRPKISKLGRVFGLGEAEDGDIVREGVEPDIHDLVWVAGDFNSPGEIFLGARN